MLHLLLIVFSALSFAPVAVAQEAKTFLEAVEVDDYFESDNLSPPVDGAPADDDYELRVLEPDEEKTQRFVVVDKSYNADNPHAMLTSAKRAMDLGRFQSAIRIYKAILEKTPDDPDVLLGYAAALQEVGNVDFAISAYDKVLAKDEENTDAHINMLGLIGERYPAVSLQRLKVLESTLTEFNPDLVGQMAFVLAKLGRYEEALNRYATIAAREPESPLHVMNMAIVADQAGMKAAAIKYYEECLELDSIYGTGKFVDRQQIFDRLSVLRS